MKKYLTLANVMKAGAAVFGLVAFFLMFGKQLCYDLLGRNYVSFSDAMFDERYGSWITFVGYLFILFASFGACATILLPKKNKLFSFTVCGLFVLGAIFVFIEAGVVNGRADTSVYYLAGAPIVAGIFAIVAGLAVCTSEFVPDKKLY